MKPRNSENANTDEALTDGNPYTRPSNQDANDPVSENQEGALPSTDVSDSALSSIDFNTSEYDDIISSLRQEAGIDAQQEIDEGQIRRNTIQQFQDEIDATNVIYDDLLNREERAGEGREGSGRAMRFAQGLVGSGRGEAQAEGIEDANREAIQALQAERAVKIGNIMGTARNEALKEITARRQAKQQGAANYLDFIKLEDQRKEERLGNVVTTMVAEGVDPYDMGRGELSQIAQNVGVDEQSLLSYYSEATQEQREAQENASREAAIVDLYNQGITDPKQIFDYINYTEGGERIGDIRLSEITAVTEALKGDQEFFNLSQGQSRYRVNADGTVERVAYNPKTYKPDDNDGFNNDDTRTPVMSFNEFIQTPEAMQVIEQAQAQDDLFNGPNEPDPLTIQGRMQILRSVYDDVVSEVNEFNDNNEPIENMTSSNKRDLETAQLKDAAPSVQRYFLNTDSGFRRHFAREKVSGNVPDNVTVSDLQTMYNDWQETSSDKGREALQQWLNSN